MNINRNTTLCTFTTLAVLAAAGTPAHAYLGSFRPQDGYNLFVPSGSVNWSDVSYYNAGQYGPNAGGGPGPTLQTPDSGLWKVTGQVGGFFTSSAARAANTPPTTAGYSTTLPGGTVPAYIVGDHFSGRNFDGSNLAVRNDTALGTGALQYDYTIDTYDFGGFNPASITSGVVSTEFYFCPNPSDPVSPDGRPGGDKFIMSFTDSAANVGLQWGYARDNEVYWRAGNAGNWTYTGVYANQANWDGVRVSIDLSADTFELEYFDVANNLWSTMAASGTALGSAMTDLTHLGWHLEDGVNTGLGGKNYFDDFSFRVPTPGSFALLGLAGALTARRRRPS